MPEPIARDEMSIVADRDATVQAIVITHAHWDHILGPEQSPGMSVVTQTCDLDVFDNT